MADWDTRFSNGVYGENGHSRQSSQGSGRSGSNKENSESTADTSSERELILRGGRELTEESRTEVTASAVYTNQMFNSMAPEVAGRLPLTHGSGSGTAKDRAAKSPYSAPPIDSIPEEEITIPNDANISSFTPDQLANFLKCLKIDDRIISHLHRKSVDGKRFSKLKDTELENLNMKNPVVMFFRDRSGGKPKKKPNFIL